jgi:hypothetical protein
MSKLKTFVAESVSPEDFYNSRWEGYVVEEIVRLLGGRTLYRIVVTPALLTDAIFLAASNKCDVFHLSCHGDDTGVELTDGTELSWKELADAFQKANPMPSALILSSCLGGDQGLAQAFEKHKRQPKVIFGTESQNKELTFSGACISWPILYTDLVKRGMRREVFIDAVKKMNQITPHEFVYRRWDGERYLRYPSRK